LFFAKKDVGKIRAAKAGIRAVRVKGSQSFRTKPGNQGMTSLRTVLALNMKEQRRILGITQAELAERVNTSTNYIALIETEKKFPTPEMLERIAAALEIDPPILFAIEIRPLTEAETLAKLQKQILGDITRFVSYRIKQLEQEIPQDNTPGTDNGPKLV
jgi:transcriptional regulator with XRE-family HTH domain